MTRLLHRFATLVLLLRLRRLPLMLVIAIVALLSVAAAPAAPATALPNAGAVAGTLILAWGLLAPLTVYKWIPYNDSRMKAITIGASVVIALIAEGLTGGIHLDLSSAAATLALGSLIYGESMTVWNLLKDSRPKLVT